MKKTLIYLLLLTPRLCWGVIGIGDVVLDPTNLIQNTFTAARTLASNLNEAAQINNQVQAYVQQAKHLMSLPVSYVDQVSGLFQQYNSVLNQAQGVSYTLKNTVAQFEQLYSTSFNGNMSLVQRAQAMLGQIRAASRAATEATAIFDKLCADQATVESLVAASQEAPGSLAAQQATNQLIGVLAEQQGSLQQMQATVGRVQIGYIMRQMVAEEQAQHNAQQYLQAPEPMPWNDRPSKGFRLPE